MRVGRFIGAEIAENVIHVDRTGINLTGGQQSHGLEQCLIRDNDITSDIGLSVNGTEHVLRGNRYACRIPKQKHPTATWTDEDEPAESVEGDQDRP